MSSGVRLRFAPSPTGALHVGMSVGFRRSMSSVRLRFAPSPTGALHIGGARTALFNYLAARGASLRGQGGALVLRVDDTDASRNVPGGEAAIMSELKWLGLDWEEGPDVGGPYGPYRQSERCEKYAAAVDRLIESGDAYRDLSPTDAPKDSWSRWRDLSREESERRKAEPHAVRFKVPRDAVITTRCEDAVRGALEWPDTAKVLREDFVLRRRDGGYLYSLCTAVDDAEMKITHVIRADEHLSNTLRQVLIAEGLGFTPPVFAHCGIVTDEQRQKLSKRSKSVRSTVGALRSDGATPLGLANYLSGLGWNAPTTSHGEKRREIFESLDELALAFGVDRISTSPSCVDAKRLRWVESQCAGQNRDEWLQAFHSALGDFPLEFAEAASKLLGDDPAFSVAEAVHATAEALKHSPLLPESPELTRLLSDLDLRTLEAAITDDAAWKKWTRLLLDESPGVTRRELMMGLRGALTASSRGPCVRRQLALAQLAQGIQGLNVVSLPDRLKKIKRALHDRTTAPE